MVVDIFMMVLLLLNLSLIVFDWLFLIGAFKHFLAFYFPSFFQFYNLHVHKNFLVIDLVFVAIYVSELAIRWIVAILSKTYHKWFFYPFVHLYDTLGCIPIAYFRFFRILRLISIFFRLQKLSIINLKKSYFYSVFNHYYNILVEEISDRVVVKILNGVQAELKTKDGITDKILEKVVMPRKELLTAWAVERFTALLSETYNANKIEIHEYFGKVMGDAIAENNEVKLISQIPIVGNFISGTMEKAVADITNKTIESALSDLSPTSKHPLFSKLAGHATGNLISKGDQAAFNHALKLVLLESLEIIKTEVEVQQWKLTNIKGPHNI